MTAHIFILAAGSAQRFAGQIKQLLPIHGEPLIWRTIRLVREHVPNTEIYVVTWREELMFDDVRIIDTGKKPAQLSDTIMLTQPAWGFFNVFLLGDVFYTPEAISSILTPRDRPTIYGSNVLRIKEGPERFALSFRKYDGDLIRETCHKSASLFTGTDLEDHGGLYKLCLATRSTAYKVLLNPFKFDSWIYPFVRPFRDFFVWKILGGPCWKPGGRFNAVVLDDETTDIDTPEDYRGLLSRCGSLL